MTDDVDNIVAAMTANERGDLRMIADHVADGTFQGQSTNRFWPKRRAERLRAKGLLDFKPMEPADGDGFTIEGRLPRIAYFPTPLGLSVAEELERRERINEIRGASQKVEVAVSERLGDDPTAGALEAILARMEPTERFHLAKELDGLVHAAVFDRKTETRMLDRADASAGVAVIRLAMGLISPSEDLQALRALVRDMSPKAEVS